MAILVKAHNRIEHGFGMDTRSRAVATVPRKLTYCEMLSVEIRLRLGVCKRKPQTEEVVHPSVGKNFDRNQPVGR